MTRQGPRPRKYVYERRGPRCNEVERTPPSPRRSRVRPGIGGTSASAPVFSALIALINDARLAAGKPALGFLNPFIYANADAFTDITVGSNKVARGGMPLTEGFNCSAGWDPVTGVGTPIYPKLLAAAMKAAEHL